MEGNVGDREGVCVCVCVNLLSWKWKHQCCLLFSNNRGGASEASVATLTGDVNGSSRYMYVRYVKPLGQLLHAHAQMVLSQQILKFIFTGKGNSGEKNTCCSGVGSNLGLMHCRPLPLPPSQWGSGSSGLQIWLLYC